MKITPAAAYWNQRAILAENKYRIMKIGQTVDRLSDLTLFQTAQIQSFALEFKPDLILELGRGKGNSTCLFTETAHILGGASECKVVSLCISDSFEKETIPALEAESLINDEWFEPLELLNTNIITFDYEKLFENYNRILVFWDAHGYAIADCVLGKILPLIKEKTHYILMHDISDQRYLSKESLSYNGQPLWRGNNDGQKRIVLGNINSAVEQAVSIVDFTSRNNIELISSDHSYHTEIQNDLNKDDEMRKLLGEELYSTIGHWFCFTLNDYDKTFNFPSFDGSEYSSNIGGLQLSNEDERINLSIQGIFNNKINFEFIHYLLINKNINAIIFGASESGKLTYRCIEEINKRFDTNIEVVAIYDNDKNKWNSDFYDLKVTKPEIEVIKNADKVIIASSAFDAIKKQLMQMDIKEDRFIMPLN